MISSPTNLRSLNLANPHLSYDDPTKNPHVAVRVMHIIYQLSVTVPFLAMVPSVQVTV